MLIKPTRGFIDGTFRSADAFVRAALTWPPEKSLDLREPALTA
jgi:hypothetical protein